MYQFLSPKIFKIIYSFLKFSGGKKSNIRLIWVNRALTPVKAEQESTMLAKCFSVLRDR